ncbi:MAG: DUF4384 domain-containing protein [Saprospiraceae bacterium]|nr:DUF4384 domain-containing protein [Saprospiraceae bacterium]
MKKIFNVSILIFVAQAVLGQFGGFGHKLSGTIITDEQKAFMKEHRELLQEYDTKVVQGLVEIPVKMHIARKSDGSGGITVADSKEMINKLNSYFLNSNLRFVLLADYNYINQDDFYEMNKENEEELIKDYELPTVLNIYVVGKIKTERNTYNGYTYLPSEKPKNRIFITIKGVENGVSLLRQIGHYFSLYPTHGPNEGQRTEESVDGQNCATAGDEICDTPADPRLDLRSIDSRCGFIGKQKDGNHKFYRPHTDNIMSDNPKDCRNRFTPEQYKRIMYAAQNIRKDLAFPKSQFSKKQLKNMQEQYGIEGEITMNLDARNMSYTLLNNMYNVNQPATLSSQFRLNITNYKKCYIYVIEGDTTRDARLLYPKKGDQLFFKNEKKVVQVPSDGGEIKVDTKRGDNYVCILFSRKQLPIVDMLKELNSQDDNFNLMYRMYKLYGNIIVNTKDTQYNNSSPKVSAITSEQYIVPVFLRYEQK